MHSADGTTTPVASHSRQASMSEGSGDPQSAPVATAKALTGYARSLQLWITEAKDMGGAQKYAPYCVVLLNDIKQARTTTKHGDSPFWGEDFRFSDIPPCRTRLRLLFFSSSTNRSQKDTEIGYISINLSNLKSGKQVESWYPLKAFSRQATEGDGTPPAAASPGMVRVAYFLTNEKTLPMNAYEEFLQIAMEPKLTCIKHLSKLLGKDKEDFAKTLVSILVAYNRDIEGIQELMSEEIMATANSNIIFRGNSVAIKSLDQYMKMIGSEYLEGTLGSLIRGVYNSKDNCEVDPTKLGQLRSKNVEEVIRKNSKRLLNHVNIFWVTIARSAEKCPPELLSIFARIKDVVSKKFPEDPNAIYSAVSGFIFLRFFCPTILSPKLFGIMSEHPDPITSRTLTLIAKIIQNLANLSEFEGKEPHMGCFNPFIVEHIQSMKAFINTLSVSHTTSAARIELQTVANQPRHWILCR
ncbi:Rho GTPase activation protein [Polychytrium aggregatum]|uniref:Rho GTPase activation protein n=1 Tax=Polychytrium aggregatum TaxID=110093 RepID=UPI0022FE5DA9|nr:Rho GTPase activation protein [Polychytrium aggregatum]KAI9205872.1 Rho GTPase activation protein [Polychytrium aggregatum]